MKIYVELPLDVAINYGKGFYTLDATTTNSVFSEALRTFSQVRFLIIQILASLKRDAFNKAFWIHFFRSTERIVLKNMGTVYRTTGLT